jgi:N-methylhydantoinase A/oxoprolinase/acetone carboxylase beta subunit
MPAELRGRIEGVATSLELPRIESLGIGGGSIVRVAEGVVHVGPESVGAAPGPACFGLGGTRATITDACVARGLIDPDSFSGIERPLDRARAEAAVANEIGTPLGLATPAAAHLVCDRWIASLAAGIRAHVPPRHDTVLMAFGGAGPLAICEVAAALGIRRVFVPKLAALFSAYGVRYAHLGQDYELTLAGLAPAAREAVLSAALATAARDMAGEGLAIADCTITARAVTGDAAVDVPLEPARWPAAAESIQLRVSAGRPAYDGIPGTATAAAEAATPSGERTVLGRDGGRECIPIYRHAALAPGMRAAGPAVLQSDYFLCHLVAGWRFTVLDGGDLLLEAGDEA